VEFSVYTFEKEKSFFSNQWHVFDESDNLVYTVSYPGFLSSENIKIIDHAGETVLEISWSFWHTTYTISENGVEIAKVKKMISLTKNEFMVTAADGTEVIIKGHWLKNEFRFLKNEDEFAFVSRKRFAFSHDRFGIAIRKEINPLFVLGIVVVIQVTIKRQEGGM
jgi:uncharacterized protein YxjI